MTSDELPGATAIDVTLPSSGVLAKTHGVPGESRRRRRFEPVQRRSVSFGSSVNGVMKRNDSSPELR